MASIKKNDAFLMGETVSSEDADLGHLGWHLQSNSEPVFGHHRKPITLAVSVLGCYFEIL
jgi:hypothetical protein